jgi:hypothetical protein
MNVIDFDLRPFFARLRMRTAEDELDHLPKEFSPEIVCELIECG